MRHQPHHRAGVLVGKVDRALDVDEALEPRGRGVPQQPTFEDAAAHELEVLKGQGATLRLVQLGKAQLEVAQRNVPARTRQPP